MIDLTIDKVYHKARKLHDEKRIDSALENGIPYETVTEFADCYRECGRGGVWRVSERAAENVKGALACVTYWIAFFGFYELLSMI